MAFLETVYGLSSTIADTYFSLFNKIGGFIYSFYADYSRTILNGMNFFFESTFKFFLILTILLAFFYLFMSIVALFKKRRNNLLLKKGEEPKVTIQIPTYNELAALNCAERCLKMDYPKDKLQIIIGDDSSKKEISKQIDDFAKKNSRILVTRRGSNIGFKPGNLNHMLKSTTGDIIIIFDSDFLPEKDFVRKIVVPYKDENVAVVQSRWDIINYSQNFFTIVGGTVTLITHQIVLPFVHLLKANTFLCGSAESIRKKDLEAAGGWRMGSLTEDVECSMRLYKMGKKLVYMPELTCKCEAPHKFNDLCKQQMRWAFGVISSMKTHTLGVFASKRTRIRDKFSVAIFSSGYMFSILILALTIFGTLSIISTEPAPINWARFLSETGRNILLTSGFLVACAVALAIGRKKVLEIPKMLAASLSVGLAVTFYVNLGIFKALFGRGMQWFMLSKLGNKRAQ
ncbi:MAG: glycosyltransferase [bacterium]|nr:glycosyltransferase [bacterium]